MAGGTGLKPKVRIVCPVCDIPLRFTCLYQEGNSVNWVLTAESRKHLAEAHVPAKLTLVSPEIFAEPYLAA